MRDLVSVLCILPLSQGVEGDCGHWTGGRRPQQAKKRTRQDRKRCAKPAALKARQRKQAAPRPLASPHIRALLLLLWEEKEKIEIRRANFAFNTNFTVAKQGRWRFTFGSTDRYWKNRIHSKNPLLVSVPRIRYHRETKTAGLLLLARSGFWNCLRKHLHYTTLH